MNLPSIDELISLSESVDKKREFTCEVCGEIAKRSIKGSREASPNYSICIPCVNKAQKKKRSTINKSKYVRKPRKQLTDTELKQREHDKFYKDLANSTKHTKWQQITQVYGQGRTEYTSTSKLSPDDFNN